ncbi:hypothetical protein G8J22_02599 [Lentilactobacillus hilgardii]|nr:hypothetical protein HMPREF0497_0076 [Lentilactobacillus buchneri ATCC 11577]QIR10588.1 hypothetical protein G8J22_02599 [Lentilactobacillus hilgardii]
MNKTWIVALETYLRQVKSWSFVILVVSPFLMLAVSLGVGYMSATSGSNTDKIAVISNNPALRKQFISTNKDDISQKVTTTNTAKRKVADDKLAGYLQLSVTNQQVSARYYSKESMDSSLKLSVENFLNKNQQVLNVQNAKLSSGQMKSLSQQPIFKQHIKQSSSSNDIVKIASFWILVFVIYMVLITYSSVTAQEIASEKGTKIMEIIFPVRKLQNTLSVKLRV